MKFKSEKIKVENIFQKAVRFSGKHLTLPVLACVYLETVGDNKVLVKATNLDVGIEIEFKSEVLEPGSVAVPANIILNTISSMREGEISFETVDNNLKISSGKNSVLIKSMSHEDFPVIPRLNPDNNSKFVKISSHDLVLGFKSVWYSASNSNIKPELGSVFVYHTDNNLIFVSTDSFRLAEKRITTKSNLEFPPVLIPYKNAVEIIKLFEDYKGDIEIILEKNQAAFMVDGLYLVSRLVDGSFPDYKQIIPKSFVAKATILKNDLLNSIKVSNIFSDNLNQVKLKINIKDKVINVESRNNDVGEYKESIKAALSGDDLELNFNNKYLTDCFQSIPNESIDLDFGGLGKPLIITGHNDKSFMYLVMSMNR
jgi:DNA polymerase-3 subunit beta